MTACEEIRLLRLAAAHEIQVVRDLADLVRTMVDDAPPDMHPHLPGLLLALLDEISTTLLVPTSRGQAPATPPATAPGTDPVVVQRDWWEARRGLLDQQPGPDEPAYLSALSEIVTARTALRDCARRLPDLLAHQPLPRGLRPTVAKQIDRLRDATIGRLDFYRRLHTGETASLFTAAGAPADLSRDDVAAEHRRRIASSATAERRSA